jgi:WD40 repeat protein
MKIESIAVGLWLVMLASISSVAQPSSPLTLDGEIALPNVKGRIDHFSVDVEGQRLFVAAVENHTVEVLDLKAGKVIHTISGLAEPQGVLYEPASNRLFVACGLDGTLKIFDAGTFQLFATVKFPDDADNIRFDNRSKQIIVGYAGAKKLRHRTEGSGGLGFIDSNGKRMGDIVIDAHPESFQVGTGETETRIFVNVPDKKEVEVIDPVKRSVLARWPVTSSENNFPMALDDRHHRLFLGCWAPPLLLAFDTETGKQVESGEIAGKTDDIFYDSQRDRIYVLTALGFLEVFQQENSDHLDRIARYPTPPGSQTGLFVPKWGKLFVGVRAQSDQSAAIRVYLAH